MRIILVGKGIVICIILLFIGINIYSAIPVKPISTIISEKKDIKIFEDLEPKEYLFHTILDITKNSDVKDLFAGLKNNWNNNLVSFEYDSKSVFCKLFLNKPSLLFSTIFTKPFISYDYLDEAYKRGIEINNILKDNIVFEIVGALEITNPDFFNELDKIIWNNNKLNNRITILSELNKDNEIICFILSLLFLSTWIPGSFFNHMYYLNPESIIWTIIFYPPMEIFEILTIITLILLTEFDCIEWPDIP